MTVEPLFPGDGDAPEAPAALHAVRNEVAEEAGDSDGKIPIVLSTINGEYEFRVPPRNKWRATAVNALMSRGDSLMWAAVMLTPAEAQEWAALDPDPDELEVFFEEFGRLGGMDLANRAQRRSSARTPKR